MTLTFTDADALEAGVYPATLRAIEEGTNENGDFRKWIFDVSAPDGSTDELRAFSTTKRTRSKAYKWATTLLGHKPPAGEPVEVTGLQCRLVLSVNEDGYNRVGDLLPPESGGSGVNRVGDPLPPESGGSGVNLQRLDAQVYTDKPAVTPTPPKIGF